MKFYREHLDSQSAIVDHTGMSLQNTFTIIGSVLLLASCSASAPTAVDSGTSSSSDVSSSPAAEATILSPAPDSVVTSPLVVTGRADNSWFFEGSLPVKVVDADGNVLAAEPGQAKTDWMTPGIIEFEAHLEFTTTARTGFIVVAKDNPSGDPERDAEIKIPVKFE